MLERFGDILRRWRQEGRYSQLQCALQANVSARHLSFLETGRAQPSRSMVMQLGNCLARSKQDINQAMLVAGFAPSYPKLSADHTDLAPLHTALKQLLDNHMPFPAFVVDRHWNLVNANTVAMVLFGELGFANYTNLIEAIIADEGRHIINWPEVLSLMLVRLRSEIAHFGVDEKLSALETQLADCVGRDKNTYTHNYGQAMIPTRFKLHGVDISLFSILAQFGAVQDVFASELKAELIFPMDEASREFFEKRFG